MSRLSASISALSDSSSRRSSAHNLRVSACSNADRAVIAAACTRILVSTAVSRRSSTTRTSVFFADAAAIASRKFWRALPSRSRAAVSFTSAPLALWLASFFSSSAASAAATASSVRARRSACAFLARSSAFFERSSSRCHAAMAEDASATPSESLASLDNRSCSLHSSVMRTASLCLESASISAWSTASMDAASSFAASMASNDAWTAASSAARWRSRFTVDSLTNSSAFLTVSDARRMRSAASILASVAATASASSRRASHAVEELVPVVFTSLSFST
mmetsp:Transcript_3653/g.14693  ORF Transcript_3653/g.14693 Transcript_3653/m.14693 type:complete len:280 (+) Transcript_3653:734-1573(+)